MSGSSGGVELVGVQPHLVPPPISYIITVASPDPVPNHDSEAACKKDSNGYFCHKSIRSATLLTWIIIKNNFSSFAHLKEKNEPNRAEIINPVQTIQIFEVSFLSKKVE